MVSAFSDANVDISSRKHKANPELLYGRLRAKFPVFQVVMPDRSRAWLVTRYADVVSVLRDARFGKDRLRAMTPEQLRRQPWMPAVFKPLTRNMLDVDEPDHARLRGLVNKAFTPALVERMRGRIQSLADQLLSRALNRKRVDLLADYALPIPTTVIAEMLGIPAGDRHKFQRWSRAIVGISPNSWGMLLAIPHVWMFLRYIRRQIEYRKKEPREDLLSALVQAEETGERLSEDELVAMVFLLIVAGHETTVNLIGNGVLCLLENPEQLARLRSGEVPIASAVEELLRLASPVETATERFALEDVEVCGTWIRRGELVFAAIASANRDETAFDEAHKCDLGRDPNRHLSFGLGSHYCLGAALARLEGQIAIGSLVRQAPNLRLAVPVERLLWRKGLVLRGLEQLPVVLG